MIDWKRKPVRVSKVTKRCQRDLKKKRKMWSVFFDNCPRYLPCSCAFVTTRYTPYVTEGRDTGRYLVAGDRFPDGLHRLFKLVKDHLLQEWLQKRHLSLWSFPAFLPELRYFRLSMVCWALLSLSL